MAATSAGMKHGMKYNAAGDLTCVVIARTTAKQDTSTTCVEEGHPYHTRGQSGTSMAIRFAGHLMNGGHHLPPRMYATG